MTLAHARSRSRTKNLPLRASETRVTPPIALLKETATSVTEPKPATLLTGQTYILDIAVTDKF